jgi:hypothetical protein
MMPCINQYMTNLEQCARYSAILKVAHFLDSQISACLSG